MEDYTITQDYTAPVILNNGAVRSRKWSFTLNNFTEEEITQLHSTFQNCKIIFGEETGESGTPHLQGYLEFTDAKTMTSVKKILGTDRVHLEPAKKNRQANINYCSKEGNVLRDDFSTTYTGRDLPKKNDLYPWQTDILALISETPDDRSIHWFYEPHGNSGKSKFGKYLCFHCPNVCLTTATKSNDILTCVEEQYDTYILDFPRTLGSDYCPYTALEQLKNGFITDAKLKKKARRLLFNPPHVIVFSNYPPDKSKLSMDRWKIFNIYTNTWEH